MLESVAAIVSRAGGPGQFLDKAERGVWRRQDEERKQMAFIETLIEMRNGGVAIELQEGLQEVVEAVRKTGKKGKLVLEVSVMPGDKGTDIDRVLLQDVVKIDAPKPDKKLSLFFANENNQLSRNDTRQMNMLDGLKDVDMKPQSAPREVK